LFALFRRPSAIGKIVYIFLYFETLDLHSAERARNAINSQIKNGAIPSRGARARARTSVSVILLQRDRDLSSRGADPIIIDRHGRRWIEIDA